jgi:hypothetical protein
MSDDVEMDYESAVKQIDNCYIQKCRDFVNGKSARVVSN